MTTEALQCSIPSPYRHLAPAEIDAVAGAYWSWGDAYMDGHSILGYSYTDDIQNVTAEGSWEGDGGPYVLFWGYENETLASVWWITPG